MRDTHRVRREGGNLGAQGCNLILELLQLCPGSGDALIVRADLNEMEQLEPPGFQFSYPGL
jgi:hypothetical protein